MPLPEKCRNLLTICRKAGKLEAGFARAKDAIQGGYAACILLTADLSEKAGKKCCISPKNNTSQSYRQTGKWQKSGCCSDSVPAS